MTAVIERPVELTAPVATVVDNAKYAWENSHQSCLAALPDDFVVDFRVQLDLAAIAALPPLLSAAWRERGFEVRFGSWSEVAASDRSVSDETYWGVWDRAADALKADDLVNAAGLNEEKFGYMEAAE